jgi:hypothetical protein
LVKPVTLPDHFIAQEKRQTDGEQIPRISPGSMTHVHAAFRHERAVCHLKQNPAKVFDCWGLSLMGAVGIEPTTSPV